jgi:DNA topoisomerase-1
MSQLLPTPLPTHVPPDILEKASEDHIRYLAETATGIERHGSKEHFTYRSAGGAWIRDKKTLERIAGLRIPPAWTEVWISPSPNTHLQATGFDQKGRKQYMYHPEWIRLTQEHKFDKVEIFGDKLPLIRQTVKKDLSLPSLSQRKVIATVVWLLEHTFIRIGNSEYARENNSFGLTTLRNKHVTVAKHTVKFSFKGKSGIEHELSIAHPTVVKTIRTCIELPGYEVFQYLDEEKKRRCVDASEVNDYLHEITQEDITAKDFRTWGGTMLSAKNLYELGDATSKKDIKKNITQAVKQVAKKLGNTPTVSRNYYIHPTVITTYQDHILIPHLDEFRDKRKETDYLKPTEYAVLELLRKYPLHS